jgi:hypothetical protein
MSDSDGGSGRENKHADKKLRTFTGNDKKLYKGFKDNFLNDLSEKDPLVMNKLEEQVEEEGNANATAAQKKILNKFRAKLYRRLMGTARKSAKPYNTTCWELLGHLEEQYGTQQHADRLGDLAGLVNVVYDNNKSGPATFCDKVSETVEELGELKPDEVKLLVLAQKLPLEYKAEVNKEVLRLDEEGEELDFVKLRGRLVNAHKLDHLREETDVAANNVNALSNEQVENQVWAEAEAYYYSQYNNNNNAHNNYRPRGKGNWVKKPWNKWSNGGGGKQDSKGKGKKGFFKGKGKKGQTKKQLQKQKTPKQKAQEGQRCFLCDSDRHQLAQCPKNKNRKQR